MLSNLSSVGAVRVTPATTTPTAPSVNPDTESAENKQPTEIVRAVNGTEKTENTSSDQSRANASRAAVVAELDPAEQKVVEKLKSRDREVRAHEQAHLSAAGSLASSGASFTYQQGPDGQRYAIGGEVGIESARVAGDPQQTIQRAQQIRRAALAPANPSAQDRSVAANAAAITIDAQAELAQLKQTGRGQSATDVFNQVAKSGADTQTNDSETSAEIEKVDTFA